MIFPLLMAGAILVGQLEDRVEKCVIHKINLTANDYGYNIVVNNGEEFDVNRYIEPDTVNIIDWDNVPMFIQQLRIGDKITIIRSAQQDFYYKIVLIEVHPRKHVSNTDFTKIQERWVAATLPDSAKPNDVFNSEEIKLLRQLDDSHPTEGFENRQKAFYKIKNLPILQLQKFLIHRERFFKNKPEVLFRLNFIEYELYSMVFDFSNLSYWAYRLNNNTVMTLCFTH